MADAALVQLAKEAAARHGLDPVLVCAVCEQESAWSQWAVRYEPAFQKKYVDPLGLSPTEATGRSFSYGLMQLMGQGARELGLKGYLTQLCDPAIGLEYGCRHLVNKLAKATGNVVQGLLYWNGGGNLNYAAQVLARMEKYRGI